MANGQVLEKTSYLESLALGAFSWSDLKRAVETAKRPPSLTMRFTKSFIDTAAVVASTPFIIPVFAAIAIAVKLDSEGDIFFKQTRTGLDGETFEIYKFRTMTQDAGQEREASQSQENDSRHTRVGRFLRRASLDELPQLINIAKGEMSLVGPRPHARYHDKLFLNSVPNYPKRFRVKPGLTGWAQVNNCRGFIESHEQIARRTNFDNDYIDRWSMKKEIATLFKTVWVVLSAVNAH
ncbi:MAG: sugar transferase [Rickettsiales bacterium]|nr:sugar transferase [Rickettsiales bacterium]